MKYDSKVGVKEGFFFQAEDGIRDYDVTGVQTCALPISVHKQENDVLGTGGKMWPLGRERIGRLRCLLFSGREHRRQTQCAKTGTGAGEHLPTAEIDRLKLIRLLHDGVRYIWLTHKERSAAKTPRRG